MKTPKTKEDDRPFKCSSPKVTHVGRRRSGKWMIVERCDGDWEHADTEFSGVLDGKRLDHAIWRRGDPRDVPALRGQRETGHAFDQVL